MLSTKPGTGGRYNALPLALNLRLCCTPRNSRNPSAFAGKSVPQEKSQAAFRKKIRTV
ncbi:hypothetical protein [Sporomusa ovata]|uniref:Uncharacterized protein n=1 Tax=Sporomusa ovata TaxID=2378 RepID=A0A0U1L5E6_9FIRM|nr:hypothetical protein [Sporomusa ovata]CQR74911.1 hypothetical protein SpAn4DRAFT_4268 [Sporomusa ovata]